jgi:hypothetical protein
MIQGMQIYRIRNFDYLEMKMLKIVTMLLAVTGLLAAQDGRRCNLTSLKGNYGTILSGTKPSGPPPAPLEQFIGVALNNFDGQGHSTGIDNIHAAISGVTTDRAGTGTYTIDDDCSGRAFLFSPGAPPLELRFVVVNNGEEFRGIVVSPTSVMVTFNAKKI